MARTHGHGNPNWTRDETILALALYCESDKTLPSRNDPRVRKLSELLRSLPYHVSASKKESFRNPDGVAFKLQNLHNVATGKGLRNVSAMDRQIWSEFGSRPDEIRSLADLIKAGVKLTGTIPESDDDCEDDEFFEGRLLTEIHKSRERNPKLRRRLLAFRRKSGRLACDLCDGHSICEDLAFEDASFEAHHMMPISMTIERMTQLRDLSLLCASCHRLVHRAIASKKRWLTIDECRELLGLPVNRH